MKVLQILKLIGMESILCKPLIHKDRDRSLTCLLALRVNQERALGLDYDHAATALLHNTLCNRPNRADLLCGTGTRTHDDQIKFLRRLKDRFCGAICHELLLLHFRQVS